MEMGQFKDRIFLFDPRQRLVKLIGLGEDYLQVPVDELPLCVLTALSLLMTGADTTLHTISMHHLEGVGDCHFLPSRNEWKIFIFLEWYESWEE